MLDSINKKVLILFGNNTNDSINFSLSHLIYDENYMNFINLSDFHELPFIRKDLLNNEKIFNILKPLTNAIDAAEIIILITPEHNGYFTAYVKNILDWLSCWKMKFFNKKYLFLLVASNGKTGGETLRNFARRTLKLTGIINLFDFGFGKFDTKDQEVIKKILMIQQQIKKLLCMNKIE